ncbi:MerR family transcriptional regulator [Nocardia asteroides]|uniref:helix-turn-helix domain-containing protein n=1 Tax=Nocardia asteroides TaxID=1824 RepID=UPI001E3487FE|nr:MerR family transcriptional regulator [Nocardia asteroides]UGT56231.1 MerR family transcriptional regulator [Nocardia asteroides]
MTDSTGEAAFIGIGELARGTGLAVRTIRFYCDEGLLVAHRSRGGHRVFDAESATARLGLIRRLRALGLGLGSIAEVVRGDRSLAEVVAAESARVDLEFRALAWRRASLRALDAVAPARRHERLALLAAAQDGRAVHDELVRFWRRILAPIPGRHVETYVGWNVPEPPVDPSVEEVVAYAELAAFAADPAVRSAVRHQLWRSRPELVRDPSTLYSAIDEALAEVVAQVGVGAPPRPGRALDRFVAAHAAARGEHDSPYFRTQLLRDAADTDPRVRRYWECTALLLGERITVGRALHWVHGALTHSREDGQSESRSL